jgi:transcriptional regulator with XRE-family HTH domain
MTIVELLEKFLKAMSQKDLALKLEVTPQYLNDVLRGRREAGPKILKGLGLKKRVSYEKSEVSEKEVAK